MCLSQKMFTKFLLDPFTAGSSIVRDNLNSFLLTKDGKILAFNSFKRCHEIDGYSNVKLFECFQNTCYVLVKQSGIDVKVQLYSSFGVEGSDAKCEFDLSFSKDAVSIDGSRHTEKICVQMIEGPFKDCDRGFLTELLACDLKQESLDDVLLISIDERLMWIKYKRSFLEGAKDGYSIETITSAKENIRGLKFCDGFLMMLDCLSILTIVHLCPSLQFITKKEILLEGQAKCFCFHQNMFVYSNLKKVVFIDATNPERPEIRYVDLKGIVCFSVVTELNCIIAICHNQMFFHIPLTCTNQQHQKRNNDNFQVLQNSDIELIPSIAKFVKAEEEKLLVIERKIKKGQQLKTLFQHLMENRDFTAGVAVVTFHRNFPVIPDSAIVCNVGNQQLGCGFVEIKINLSNILTTMTFSVAFYRHALSGVLTQTVEVVDAKETVFILLPAENNEDSSNKMSLDVNFTYDFKGESRLLIYPVDINLVVPFDGPRVKLKHSLDNCLEIVNKRNM